MSAGRMRSPGAKAFRDDAKRLVLRAEMRLEEAKTNLARWEKILEEALAVEEAERTVQS